MNDETKAELMKRAREWLQSCVNAATRSGVPEEADLEAFILAHLDGEPARLAAAREEAIMAWRAGAADRDELRADCERRIAAAREEQREACELRLRQRADDIVSDGGDKTLAIHMHRAADWIEDTPLDATPLADELRTLRERMAVVLHAGPSTGMAVAVFDRAKKAEAQVAAARAVCEGRIKTHWRVPDVYITATEVLRAMDEAAK